MSFHYSHLNSSKHEFKKGVWCSSSVAIWNIPSVRQAKARVPAIDLPSGIPANLKPWELLMTLPPRWEIQSALWTPGFVMPNCSC